AGDPGRRRGVWRASGSAGAAGHEHDCRRRRDHPAVVLDDAPLARRRPFAPQFPFSAKIGQDVIMPFRLLLPCFSLLLLWLPLGAAAGGLASLSALEKEGYRVGAEVRLLPIGAEPGRTLGSIAPSRELSPASVTKVYT